LSQKWGQVQSIFERAKTPHAKAPRRKAKKAITLGDLSVFAPLRETAYFFHTITARCGCVTLDIEK
jgi:DNA-directed RNA polymerase beta' subunit